MYPAGTFRNIFALMADSGLRALLLWRPYSGREYPDYARAPIPANGESLVVPDEAKEFLLVEMRRYHMATMDDSKLYDLFEGMANDCALMWTLKKSLCHWGFLRTMAAERGGFFDHHYGSGLHM